MAKRDSIFSAAVNGIRQDVAAIAKKDFTIFRPPSYYGYTSKRGLLDNQGDVSEMYRAFKSLAYACISVRAKEVANAGRMGKFKAYRETGLDEYKRLPNTHPMVQLLRHPNPWLSRWMVWYLTVCYMDTTGNAYWWLAKDKLGVPREIWPIPSDVPRIVPGDPAKGEDLIVGYNLVWDRGEEVFIRADDIVHLKHPSLTRPYYYGDSLIMKAAIELDIDEFVALHQREFFKNDAMPGVIITFPTFLKEEFRKEFEQKWLDKFTGKAGKPAFLEGGANVTTLVNQRELDYLNTRGINTKRIQAVFGVPDSKIMQSETITARATLETIEYNFQKETIEPILVMLDEQITMDLARIYFGPDAVVRHDSTIPKDLASEAELDERYFNIGVTSINEIRKRRGDEPIEGGDQHYVPFNAVPLENAGSNPGAAKPKPSADQPPQNAYEKDLTEAYKRSYWQQFEQERMRHERRFTQKIKGFYRTAKEDVLSRINASPEKAVTKVESSDLVFNIDDFFAKLAEILGQSVPAILQAGFERFIRMYQLDGLVYAPNDPEIRRAITNIADKSRSIVQTLHGDLAEQLDEGIRLHESPAELAVRISRFFDNVVDYRSIRTARTVSTYALNYGQSLAAIRSGIFDSKTWISQRDNRVRDNHAPGTGIDGTKIGILEEFTFPDGDSVEMPADPAGKAENTVNCRCVLFFSKASAKEMSLAPVERSSQMPEIHVHIPKQDVNVQVQPNIEVKSPGITITQPDINVILPSSKPKTFIRDNEGKIIGVQDKE